MMSRGCWPKCKSKSPRFEFVDAANLFDVRKTDEPTTDAPAAKSAAATPETPQGERNEEARISTPPVVDAPVAPGWQLLRCSIPVRNAIPAPARPPGLQAPERDRIPGIALGGNAAGPGMEDLTEEERREMEMDPDADMEE